VKSVPQASWIHEPDNDHTIERNWLFELKRKRYRSSASKKTHDYYVIELADAVHAIAVTPDRELVLVRQFRAGAAKDSLETPGGLLEPGEDPLEAGARELLEETGYAGDPPRSLGSVWSNSSLLSSKITTVSIENARRVGEKNLDPGEEIEIVLVPVDQIRRYIKEGLIDNVLVVASLLEWIVDESERRSKS
jgi:8-oxo-dGTP pyrophosphatase MutT (NUDIX family)